MQCSIRELNPFRALVESVMTDLCVASDSVHLTGVSNGGMFSYYAASRLR